MKTNDYDLESVFYCEDCLSLLIKEVAGTDYCCDCGSTNIKEAEDIFVWKRLYKNKYEKSH